MAEIRSWQTRIVLAGLSLPFLFCARGGVPSPARAFDLQRGVVIDPVANTAYTMSPDHGIAAIDLTSGSTRWLSRLGEVPLAASGERIFAQAAPEADSSLVIVGFDRNTPGEVLLRTKVPLSGGARPLVDDGPGSRFQLAARPVEGALLIYWAYQSYIVTGIAPSRSQDVDSAKGEAQIDLRTGSIAPLDQSPVANPLEPKLPPSLPGVEDDGRGRPAVQRLSGDGRHLLVSRRVPDSKRPFEPWIWSIHEVATGKLAGEHRSHSSADFFFVLSRRDEPLKGSRASQRTEEAVDVVVHLQEPYSLGVGPSEVSEPTRLLRAFELRGGRELWRVPVRNTRYRGPLPPGTR